MSNLYFQIVAFFFAVTLLVVYKLKVNINNQETKLYYYLLGASFFDSVFMSIIIFLGYKFPSSPLIYVLNRLDFIMYLAWAWCFFLYIYNISIKGNEKKLERYKKTKKITGIINFFVVLLILSLKINLHNTFKEMYAYGPAVNCVYISCAVYIIMIVGILIKNYNKLKDKKYAPVYTFAFMAVVLLVVRKINPSLLLIPLILVYINLIMFFTMENPDLKMILELENARDKAEKYSNDKATFLFNITQRIRNPLNKIETLAKEIQKEEEMDVLKQKVNDIALASENIQYIVKDALDISQVDAKKINMVETKYDLKKVINESILRLQSTLEDDNINIYKNISEDIPDLLYGDPIKMKQIFNTLLFTSKEYTESGTIQCNVSCIKLMDICRIIINIEDTGIGIDKEKVEELINNSSDEDLKTLDKSIVSLGTLKKIINLIGGTINVISTPNKGTVYSVVIDQKKVKEEFENANNIINKYDEYLNNKTNVLIISDLDDFSDKFKNMFSSKHFDVSVSKSVDDSIDKIEKINIIFLDEMLGKNNSKDLLDKLRNKLSSRIPIILVCDSYKKEVLENYIVDGFTECLLKPVKLKELDEILERQVKRH